MTEIIRSDRPDESPWAEWGVLAITFFVFLLSGLTIFWISYVDITFFPVALGSFTLYLNLPSLWIGFIFVGMAVVVDLYRKHFVPDEMVDKVRLQKIVPRREFK